MSNIDVLVRAFYDDLALGCRGDAHVPLGAERPPPRFFASPAPMRGNLSRAPATKCSWPHSLSDRLGDVSKTNAYDISAPLYAIALKQFVCCTKTRHFIYVSKLYGDYEFRYTSEANCLQ
jgi:hypothetical protein